MHRQMGLKDDEYEEIVHLLGREPNFTELGMFAVMWSEHCSYKHSRQTLRRFPSEGERVLQGPGENAGVIDIGEGMAVAFKVESHNHPSAIEPYQGAATGVGGILRDIFTMGAQPVAILNSLRFGPPDDSRTCFLIDRVVDGIGGYGNCVGIPTVAGEIYFEECYRESPLVNAMAVGGMPLEMLSRGAASEAGDVVILVGARTGRDGIHGVTFASEGLDEKAEEKRPSVQVGDPFMEKILMEFCLEAVRKKLVAGMQDLGGAGLTCAVTETSSRGGTGMEIDLDQVPCREENMNAYEIMLSESQERMLLIVKERSLEALREILERWELPFGIIGRVTNDGIVNVWYRGEMVVSVPAKAVAEEAPAYEPASREPAYIREKRFFKESAWATPEDYQEAFLNVLSSCSIASKEWAWKRYDHMVRTSTVLLPGQGDAAVLRLRGTSRGLAVTIDGNGRMVYLDPYRGGMMTVAEATRNISCVGGKPLGITDCLNFGCPENPEVFWQFEQAVKGMAEACEALSVPVVSGNVSFYNESKHSAIYPTPVVGAVGLLDDVSICVSMGFKKEGDVIVLLGCGDLSLGGSEFLKVIHGEMSGRIPDLVFKEEKRLQKLIRQLARKGVVSSAHDLSDGGLGIALAECCISGGNGADLSIADNSMRPDLLLFGEGPSRILVSLPEGNLENLKKMAGEYRVPLDILGKVRGRHLKVQLSTGETLIDLPTSIMKSRYLGGREPV